MAEKVNRNLKYGGKKIENKSCDIIFDGGLQSSTRGAMVNELIKYFMYERQQIPEPYDYAKREFSKCAESIGDKTSDTKLKPTTSDRCKLTSKKRMTNTISLRKTSSALNTLEDLFFNLQKTFEQCPEISEIMIILGSTVISPKETYIILMPPLSPDAENIVFRSCVKILFRQLITYDLLADVKAIAPTNMSVLIKAPRKCNIEWFVPKHNFKRPTRGRQFVFNCQCKQPVSVSHDLTHDHSEFEMSGIDCLDSIDIDISDALLEDVSLSELLSRRVSLGYHSQTSSATLHAGNEDENTSTNEDDNMWFQSPVVVKGYKERHQTK